MTSLTGSNIRVQNDRKDWLRKTLRLSRREAAASATASAVSDNFLNAFAIHLQASLLQMSWLTAIPQLLGAWLQLVSIWMDRYVGRRHLVVGTAILQALAIGMIAILAMVAQPGHGAVTCLIALAMLYQAGLNLNQPHWRAWLGRIVPPRRRGAFFAGRTQLTMLVSMLIFMLGGALLDTSQAQQATWFGFALLFAIATCGRLGAAAAIAKMHDPDGAATVQIAQMGGTLIRIREAWADPAFRQYSLYVAGMQGAVAVSAPFFAVYMLRDLEFTYLEYTLNSSASIATQFLSLKLWGRVSDRYGNRFVMGLTSCVIPVIPFLWLVSPNYAYLILAQILSGIAWSGFSLSTGNYLYDIRPGRTHFATYAAVQSITSACFVLVGALAGGAVANQSGSILALLPDSSHLNHGVFVVFVLSGVLRFVVVTALWPKAGLLRTRHRPKLRQVIFRVSRINTISGLALDWITVGRRKRTAPADAEQRP